METHTVKPRPEAHMDMILVEVFFKSIDLIPQQQIYYNGTIKDNAIVLSDLVELHVSGYSSKTLQKESCPYAPLDEVLRYWWYLYATVTPSCDTILQEPCKEFFAIWSVGDCYLVAVTGSIKSGIYGVYGAVTGCMWCLMEGCHVRVHPMASTYIVHPVIATYM